MDQCETVLAIEPHTLEASLLCTAVATLLTQLIWLLWWRRAAREGKSWLRPLLGGKTGDWHTPELQMFGGQDAYDEQVGHQLLLRVLLREEWRGDRTLGAVDGSGVLLDASQAAETRSTVGVAAGEQ